jgi:hypothetical protein
VAVFGWKWTIADDLLPLADTARVNIGLKASLRRRVRQHHDEVLASK